MKFEVRYDKNSEHFSKSSAFEKMVNMVAGFQDGLYSLCMYALDDGVDIAFDITVNKEKGNNYIEVQKITMNEAANLMIDNPISWDTYGQ